jgi:hypothetical protein
MGAYAPYFHILKYKKKYWNKKFARTFLRATHSQSCFMTNTWLYLAQESFQKEDSKSSQLKEKKEDELTFSI